MGAFPTTELPPETHHTGLDFWMSAASEGCDKILPGFDPEAVHALRVALRRCRSMADGLTALDPNLSWRKIKAQSKKLFQSLGSLRDVQVMKDWVQHLSFLQEESFFPLRTHLAEQESLCRQRAAEAVLKFDQKKWDPWVQALLGRMQTIPLEGRHIDAVQISRAGDILLITIPGYPGNGASAQKVAAARHLLEVACRISVMVR